MPVGFVRLVKTGADCEMVLVIGDRDNWGRKLGASAIREGMKPAFFDMRADKLVAKIHPNNVRSINAFVRCGFQLENETPTMASFALSDARYRWLLRESDESEAAHIYITEIDKARLLDIIAIEQGPTVVELKHELERAIVVDLRQVAPDVVIMNSRVLLQVDDDKVVLVQLPEVARTDWIYSTCRS